MEVPERRKMGDIKEIPIWRKALLTIEEASLYSNIGRDKLTELTNLKTCDFVIYKGTHKLINRKKFEQFLENRNIEGGDIKHGIHKRKKR